MAYPWIPDIVKHCTVAIYREGSILGTTQKDRFVQCFEIAKSRLAQYGFVQILPGGPVTAIGLTPKGRAREKYHKREGRSKSVLFDTLFELFDLDGTRAEREKKAAQAAEALHSPDAQAGGQPKAPAPANKPVPKRKRL